MTQKGLKVLIRKLTYSDSILLKGLLTELSPGTSHIAATDHHGLAISITNYYDQFALWEPVDDSRNRDNNE